MASLSKWSSFFEKLIKVKVMIICTVNVLGPTLPNVSVTSVADRYIGHFEQIFIVS